MCYRTIGIEVSVRVMNCHEVFQLHTFKRKGGSDKIYNKPKQIANPLLSDKVIKWFEKRGISNNTLS